MGDGNLKENLDHAGDLVEAGRPAPARWRPPSRRSAPPPGCWCTTSGPEAPPGGPAAGTPGCVWTPSSLPHRWGDIDAYAWGGSAGWLPALQMPLLPLYTPSQRTGGKGCQVVPYIPYLLPDERAYVAFEMCKRTGMEVRFGIHFQARGTNIYRPV